MKKISVLIFVASVLAISWICVCKVSAQGSQAGNQPVGTLLASLPSVVEVNQAFDFDIWFQPCDPKYNKPVTVYMEQRGDINYDVRYFELMPFKRKTVRARIVRSRSGLTVIRANSNECGNLEKAVNAGFPLKLSAPLLENPVESNSTRYFIIDFKDHSGKPVPLGSNVKFSVKAYKGEFKTAKGTWSNEVFYELKKGSSAGQVLTLRPERTYSTEKGMIHIETMIDNDTILRTENIEFTVSPSQKYLLFMAIIGGLLYGLYLTTKEISSTQHELKWFLFYGLIKMAAGAVTGAISFFLVDWDVLGIKLDTTSAKGFVILGFLFSYVGIDTIIKKITEVKKTSRGG